MKKTKKNKGLLDYEKNKRLEAKKKIKKAVEKKLKKENTKIVMKDLAVEVGMSRVNLYQYKDFIEEIKKEVAVKKLNLNNKNLGLKKYQENRRIERKEQIKEAVNNLKKTSQKITMKNIADIIKISRSNLYLYKDFIDSLR